MSKTLRKDILRMISATKGRFLSLTAIVAIGVAFFVGVSASSPMMAHSVDAYGDATNLKDLTVYSDLGFDQADVDAIQNLEDIELAEGSKFVDVVASSGDLALITRIHSYSPDAKINQFVLKEGRLPETNNEVVAEKGSDLFNGFPLGSKVLLSRPDNDLDDFIDLTEVTVVGLIDTPLYVNETKENSTLGNQYLRTYFYIPESAFTTDYYLEVNALTTDGQSMNSFSQKYADYDASVKETIENLATSQASVRRDSILEEANEKYEDGLKEYEDGLQEYNEKIADAETKIQDAEAELRDGEQEIADAKKKLTDSQKELDEQSLSAQIQIQDARNQIASGEAQLKKGREELEQKKSEYSGLITQMETGITQIQSFLSMLQKPAIDDTTPVETFLLGIADPTQKEAIRKLVDGISNPTIGDLCNRIDLQQANLEQAKNAFGETALAAYGLTLNDPITAFGTQKAGLENANTAFVASTNSYPGTTLIKDCDASVQGLAQALATQKVLPDDFLTLTIDQVKTILTTTITNLGVADTNVMGLADQFGLPHETTFAGLNAALDTQITALSTLKSGIVYSKIHPAFADDVKISVLLASMSEEQRQQIQPLLDMVGMTADHSIGELKTALSNQVSTLQSQIQQIQDGLAAGEKELADGEATLKNAYDQTVNASVELEEKVADGQAQIDDGWATLNSNLQTLEDGKAELEDAKKELEDAKADGKQELDDAKAELDKAKQDIDDIAEAKWTVLDRSQHYGSETYKASVKQMKSIANVFPVFFFLVAALVCLTTMTRMVDEQRGQIGILRALGYTEFQCAGKYLVYAIFATLVGEVLGSIFGLLLFPGVIYNAWKMMYVLPDMVLTIPWDLIFAANISFLAVMLLTTWYACNADMKEVPSQLMRPKSPKLGKSTIIEKIPIIWKHLSFTWKVTIRNLLRYKKRLVMTVIGVAGCTALLITGYGVRDSITTLVDVQFGEIVEYSGIASVKEGLSVSEIQNVKETISDRSDVKNVLLEEYYSSKIYAGEKEETVRTEVYLNPEDLSKNYVLKDASTKHLLSLPEDGVIITEKLAKNLKLSVGDTLTMESKNGVRKDVTISAISQMYIYHYVFMSETYYEKIFGTDLSGNAFFIQGNDSLQVLQKDLVDMDTIDSIEFYDVVEENFNSMVKSLDLIVLVLIISSMSLAFVVLGNLTSVNISERQREIATLKVLGFRANEVNRYIYKENNVLTTIGAIAGMPLGILLHHYIMNEINMDYVMFGKDVYLTSLLLSALITIGFGILVNLFMSPKLQKIEMVESLKSVE